jgi:hypothetical protein
MKVEEPLPQRAAPVACNASHLWSYPHRREVELVRSGFFASFIVGGGFDRGWALIVVMSELLGIKTGGDANPRGGGPKRGLA